MSLVTRLAATPLVVGIALSLIGSASLGLLTQGPVPTIATLVAVGWIRFVSEGRVPGPPRSVLILSVVAGVADVAVPAVAVLLVGRGGLVLGFVVAPVVMTYGRTLAEERFGLSRLRACSQARHRPPFPRTRRRHR